MFLAPAARFQVFLGVFYTVLVQAERSHSVQWLQKFREVPRFWNKRSFLGANNEGKTAHLGRLLLALAVSCLALSFPGLGEDLRAALSALQTQLVAQTQQRDALSLGH